MDGEDTRDDDCCEEHGEYDRCRDRHSEDRDRVVDRAKYPRHISDKKEHKWSSCPEKMIVDEICRFSDLLTSGDIFLSQKLWDDILDISTSPTPASELLILRSHCPVEIGLVDEIHLTYRRSMDDAKSASPSEVAPPVLKTIFDDRCE